MRIYRQINLDKRAQMRPHLYGVKGRLTRSIAIEYPYYRGVKGGLKCSGASKTNWQKA